MQPPSSHPRFGKALAEFQDLVRAVSMYLRHDKSEPLWPIAFCRESGLPYLEEHGQEDPLEVSQFCFPDPCH